LLVVPHPYFYQPKGEMTVVYKVGDHVWYQSSDGLRMARVTAVGDPLDLNIRDDADPKNVRPRGRDEESESDEYDSEDDDGEEKEEEEVGTGQDLSTAYARRVGAVCVAARGGAQCAAEVRWFE
jgi:hypothetical protein